MVTFTCVLKVSKLPLIELNMGIYQNWSVTTLLLCKILFDSITSNFFSTYHSFFTKVTLYLWKADLSKAADFFHVVKLMKNSWTLVQAWHTVVSKIIGLTIFSPLDSIVYKSCNIECWDNKMHKIFANMMLSQYLHLKLTLLWRTSISG